MIKTLTISKICLFVLVSTLSLAESEALVDFTKLPGHLDTHLTRNELLRVQEDEKTYPHFMEFVKRVHKMGSIRPMDKRNGHLSKASHFFEPNQELWDEFFKAAVADRLTCLRAFTLLAREVKKSGMVVFGPGKIFEDAVKNNKIDLGLAVPARNIGAAIWVPDPSVSDPEFLVHLKIFYTDSFIHQFPDEVLPANLKIGFNEPVKYWLNGESFSQPAVEADLYYGAKKGIGFRNVKGVGGQKRGLIGFFQKVLFFLPDAVDSMTIREDKGEMITEALVNTTVKEFETKPFYAIRTKSE